jgi:cytochrome P450
MTSKEAEINFFDRGNNNCPYPAYERLQSEAPIWKDPVTGMYLVTRYEDVRNILADTRRFSNQVSGSSSFSNDVVQPEDAEAASELRAALEFDEKIQRLYEEKGWPPSPNMDALDDPRHHQLRRTFEAWFRPAAIAALEGYVEALADRLLDAFFERRQCEFVSEFAIPLPLFVIGRQMGLSEKEMLIIKPWTEAFVRRLGLMQTPRERLRSAEQEIEFQHFFKPKYDRLRREPDGSLLSDLVNTVIPEWGRPLTDAELHAELMIDFMVGGSETTTNALSAGVLLLIRDQSVYRMLMKDLEGHLPAFIEEVLRLESPVQGLLRQALVDVEFHGIEIPKGSIINVRFGAANRDSRQFACPEFIDLNRQRPKSHLAFGAGTHHCLGAPLARLELHFGFKVLLERLKDIRLADDATELEYHPNYFLRALKELHITFRPEI